MEELDFSTLLGDEATFTEFMQSRSTEQVAGIIQQLLARIREEETENQVSINTPRYSPKKPLDENRTLDMVERFSSFYENGTYYIFEIMEVVRELHEETPSDLREREIREKVLYKFGDGDENTYIADYLLENGY